VNESSHEPQKLPHVEPGQGPGIIILGGFLSPAAIYTGFGRTLSRLSGHSVYIVGVKTVDWLPSITPLGWLRLLNKLDYAVRQVIAEHGDQVTLIGHSAGGVLSRLYLGQQPLFGRRYDGKRWVKHVITLGSPHYNEQRWRGGMMSRWVQNRYPDAFFAGPVRYTSVAGRIIQGKEDGTPREQFAFRSYRDLAGDGTAWGDGMIPVKSALLRNSQQITLEGVSHYRGFGGPWFGDDNIVERWWFQAQAADTGSTP
jgi:pimeloyl-ACP methyl ester carboxylesterase